MDTSIIHLSPEHFQPGKTCLLQSQSFLAETFRFGSGVCALQLRNARGHLTLLPYQGQQIWSAWMDGRELTMKSMFEQPYPTRDFLATFGGFLVHCGGSANGIPGQAGALHGQLPNAPYETAELVLGEDEYGCFIGLTGRYHYTVAFYDNYLARPMVKLYADAAVFRVSLDLHNLKQSPMEMSYLAHVNFRPVDGGRLVYSAPCTPQGMRVNTELGAHLKPGPGYQEFVEDLAAHPEKHLVLKPGQMYDPEVVLQVAYQAGADGWARQMQIHPDGSADIVRHRPAQLGRGVRWICRTPDQDAIGFEPSSGKGANGVITLAGRESFYCEIEVGRLEAEEVEMEEKLAAVE